MRPPERAKRFRNLRQALQDPHFEEQVDHDESLALPCVARYDFAHHDGWLGTDERRSSVGGLGQPGCEAAAGEDPKKFMDTLRKVVNDPTYTVEPVPGDRNVA